ncbi:hypothetical protein MHYP_G00016370 [Metynnis hypsauchen]
MRPLSVLLCAVTITCFCYCDPRADFTLTQTPSELTVKEGGSVTIHCCWDKNITGVKVRWFKDDPLTGVWSDERLRTEIQRNCSVLSIKNISDKETGLYICEVTRDVPVLDIRKGKGTAVRFPEEEKPDKKKSNYVTIHKPPSTKGPIKTRSKDVNSHKPPSTEENKVPFTTHDGVVYAVRCLPFIALLLAVCYLNHGTKRRPQPKPRAQNILNAEEEERELVEGEEQTEEEREQDGGNEQVEEETGLEERNEQTRTERELEEEDKERVGKVELEARHEQTRQEREVKDEEKDKRSEEVLVEKKGADGEEQDVKIDEPAERKRMTAMNDKEDEGSSGGSSGDVE